jgi:putative phosphoesterase
VVAKIGIVSDIHCQAATLAAVLAELADIGVDEIWCAGDIVVQYRFCGETIGLLRDAGAIAIQGNHDQVLISPAGAAARESLSPDDPELRWLAALPLRREAERGGRQLLMVHGSPWPPYGDYLRPGHQTWRRAETLEVDVVITGHTHEPMVERVGRTLVINPGSVGEPRQRPDRRSTYAVLDLDEMVASIAAVDAPA